MINKVTLSPVNVKNQAVQSKGATAPQKNENNLSFEGSKVQGAKLAGAYQALNGIKTAKTVNFAGSMDLSDLEKQIITPKEIRIENLLALSEDIDLPLKKMPEGTEKLNAAGLNVTREIIDDKNVFTVSNFYRQS